jgi:hypothetical protein
VAGEHTSAKSLFEKVAKLDPKFRDAAERAKGSTPPPPADDGEGAFDLAGELANDAPPPSDPPPPEDSKKKGKISYV